MGVNWEAAPPSLEIGQAGERLTRHRRERGKELGRTPGRTDHTQDLFPLLGFFKYLNHSFHTAANEHLESVDLIEKPNFFMYKSAAAL